MTLRYSLLGPMSVVGSDGEVEIGGLKQRSVLALLLIYPNQPLTADRLIEELWQDTPPSRALATLQTYISNLRRLLEPDRPARQPSRILKTNGGGYQLDVGPAEVDTLQFEQLVSRAMRLNGSDPARTRSFLNEALELWRGSALADFAYEPFAQPTINHLDELRVTALEERLGADLALGEAASLIPELERLASEHPLRERLWGHLMLALYRADRQGEALRTFRTFETRLAEELGISPGQDLCNLELDILNHEVDLPIAKPTLERSSRGSTDILGREDERTQFQAALARTDRGAGSIIVIEGEPGIGKTRLLEALERDARVGGAVTALARCVEVGGTPPYWPWTQLIRRVGADAVLHAAGKHRNLLVQLLPVEAVASRMPATGPLLFQVAEGLTSALASMADARPIVLIIDDIYSADPDSISLLVLIAAEIATTRIVIVASHRGVDLGPDHPLTAAMASLIRLDCVERWRLSRFGRDDAGNLAASIAESTFDSETIDAIHAAAEGNAFFTVELARLLDSEHLLNPTEAMNAVPISIREVVMRRLGPAEPAGLELVRTAAVAGREFNLSVIADACRMSFDEALTAIERMVQTGLIEESEQPGSFRFSHLIVANSVAHDVGALRKAQIHDRIASALEKRHGSPTHLSLEIARHRVAAVPVAGVDQAAAALTPAIEFALESSALELAERLALQQLELVTHQHRGSRPMREETLAHLYLVRIWTWTEGYHSSRIAQALERLWILTGLNSDSPIVPEDQPFMTSDPTLSTLQAKISQQIVSGNLDGARTTVGTYMELSKSHPDPMVVFGANVNAAVLHAHTGDVTESLEAFRVSEAALDILDPTRTNGMQLPLDQQSARVTHHSFYCLALWLAGDLEGSERYRMRAREVSETLEHGFTTAFCATVEGLVGAMSGSPDRVAEALRWARDGTPSEFDLMSVWTNLQETYVSGMQTAEPAKSARQIRDQLAILEAGGSKVFHTLYWAMIAELELRSLSPARALEACETGIQRTSDGERFWYPELERLAGEARIAMGDIGAARAARARARESAEAMGIIPLIERSKRRSAAR